MKYRILATIFLYLFSGLIFSKCEGLLDEEVKILNEKKYLNLCEYSGKTILVVNTASKCGFTYQYEELEQLQRRFSQDKFTVLGFPSRNFLYQEFTNEEEVAEFCKSTFDITFPLFSITNVNAVNTHPFFEKLFKITQKRPTWNFHKYLITRQGEVKSFSHKTNPSDPQIVQAIQQSIDS